MCCSSKDIRYGTGAVAAHNGRKVQCLAVVNLREIFDQLLSYQIILIDEGHFIPDLIEVVLELVNVHAKKVFVSGLDTDYELKPWPQMIELMGHANTVEKIAGVCRACYGVAVYNIRIGDSKEKEQVGPNYYSVCRTCHLNHAPALPVPPEKLSASQ
jgi:thymidine kinase